jgi:hypothetical protein
MGELSEGPHAVKTRLLVALTGLGALLIAAPAHASLFHGETLDTIADVMSWIVLVVAPAIFIAVFWIVHILPEKIAEKKEHPQAKAIQTLCLLSLVFGGLLWPLAWLWAYSKPVFYKAAYGVDRVPHGHDDAAAGDSHASGDADEDDRGEIERLRAQVSELQSRLARKPRTETAEGGSA